MSSWWNPDSASPKEKSMDPIASVAAKARDPVVTRSWQFKVFVNEDLRPIEGLSLTGSCDQLGNWNPKDSIALERIEGKENIWSATVDVPANTELLYRYFISSRKEPSVNKVNVIRWETHLQPRKLTITDQADKSSGCYDTFGDLNGVTKIDRGWLTSDTVVQFVFFRNPFSLQDPLQNKEIRVKITPMNLRITSEEVVSQHEDSKSNVQVSTLGRNSQFVAQSQFGTTYAADDVLIIQVTVDEPENVAYSIDLYAHQPEESPKHLGHQYILPNILQHSEGVLDLPVTCATRKSLLGMMHVEYLKITPLPNSEVLSLERSYIRYWNSKWTGLEVGHRGSGTSFKLIDGNVIRENTIASLKKAASNGADMVEFDVQLSKDQVPVIYHDFGVYVSLKRKLPQDTTSNDLLQLPMADLTLDQLRNLKVYHTEEGKKRQPRFFDEDLEEHQPFPTLALAMDTIDENVGFNVEIKWSQRLSDGTTEAVNRFDKNLYLDCILKVVLKHANKRRIVFSCFDADVVTMLRLKQNLYPVMFLTTGVTVKYQPYYDPRGTSHGKAIEHALAMELLGVVGHTEDLLQDQKQIKRTIDSGLVLFCWGDENNSIDTIRLLKSQGLHAVIYDKMETLTTKEKRENIFLLAARGSQLTGIEAMKAEGMKN